MKEGESIVILWWIEKKISIFQKTFTTRFLLALRGQKGGDPVFQQWKNSAIKNMYTSGCTITSWALKQFLKKILCYTFGSTPFEQISKNIWGKHWGWDILNLYYLADFRSARCGIIPTPWKTFEKSIESSFEASLKMCL